MKRICPLKTSSHGTFWKSYTGLQLEAKGEDTVNVYAVVLDVAGNDKDEDDLNLADAEKDKDLEHDMVGLEIKKNYSSIGTGTWRIPGVP